MENWLISMPLSVRSTSLRRLLAEGCVITQCTIHKYLHDLVKAQYAEFTQLVNDSIRDFKVAFYILEPEDTVSETQKEIYRLQKKYFKYKKVEEPKVLTFDSDEDM